MQVFTQAPPARPEIDAFGAAGSYGTWRAAGKIGGTYEGIGGSAGYSQFRTDGYRDWSWARRDITNGRLQMKVGPDATLTVLGFYVGQPNTQDPGSLTQQQVEQNRRQAGTDTVRFGARKSINHGQGGAIYEIKLTPQDTVSLMGYVGDRQVTQFLAFQAPAISGSGGVVDLDRSFGGVWLTWRHSTELAGGPLNVTAAVNYDNMLERRKGFVNDFGFVGALRRDEQDRVDDFAQLVQAEWQFAPRWKISGGVRHTTVGFSSTDYFIRPGNPDDSGSTDYSAWLPVGGILYELTPAVNLYASAGKCFETPTFAELAYRPDGLPGLNFALQPARSNIYEAGVKSLIGGIARVNAVGFYSVTDQDIVSAGQAGAGRNVFTNAQQTTRGGFELSGDAQFGAGFSGVLAYTYLDAKFEDYVTVTGVDFSGKRIPGVPQNQIYGALKWQPAPTGFSAAIEGRYAAKVYANDANTAYAPSYGIFNLVASWTEVFGPLRMQAFFRVDNVADKQYIGSVIVNAANDRFFEPSPTRNVLGGVSVRYSF